MFDNNLELPTHMSVVIIYCLTCALYNLILTQISAAGRFHSRHSHQAAQPDHECIEHYNIIRCDVEKHFFYKTYLHGSYQVLSGLFNIILRHT